MQLEELIFSSKCRICFEDGFLDSFCRQRKCGCEDCDVYWGRYYAEIEECDRAMKGDE